MSSSINLLTLNCSNWRSVYAALILAGKTVNSLNTKDIINIKPNSTIIIPGVGHISALAKEIEPIISINDLSILIKYEKIKVIGICLGFHFLCSKSNEDDSVNCLNVFDKEVKPLYSPPKPSVGWSNVFIENISNDLPIEIINTLNKNMFYFTHSYGVSISEVDDNKINVWSYSPLNSKKQIAAIFQESFIGFQFHPEKSGSAGIKLLASSIDYLNES